MFRRLVFLMLALGMLGLAPSAHAATAVSISIFHNDLAPYGRWVAVAPYGTVWMPTRVGPGWRPYTNGYWTYTDYGWTWVSYEPFGADTYHYGRWLFDPAMGWVWVPDTVWAPAWVAWHEGDDWVGWAPLPPAARWEPSGRLYYASSVIQPTSWIFVERPYFLNRHIKGRIVPVSRNTSLLGATRDVTSFSVRQGKPVNQGIDVARVESINKTKVQKTYTGHRQNLRTQQRAPQTHVSSRRTVAKRSETVTANRQEQSVRKTGAQPTQTQKAQKKNTAGAKNPKGQRKP